MKIRKKFSISLLAISLSCFISFSSLAASANYARELAACLVRSTSIDERNDLIKWIFAAIASHPEVRSMSNISASTRQLMNKKTAKLFEVLVSERCRSQTVSAVQVEGRGAISFAFKKLGEFAAQGIMTHPDVEDFVKGMDSYLDHDKLDSLVERHKREKI